MNDFETSTKIYQNLLDLGESYYFSYSNIFDRCIKNSHDDQEKHHFIWVFINTLINKKTTGAKKTLVKYNKLFNKDIFDKINKIIKCSTQEEINIILDNFLDIFNNDKLLFINYTTDLIKNGK